MRDVYIPGMIMFPPPSVWRGSCTHVFEVGYTWYICDTALAQHITTGIIYMWII